MTPYEEWKERFNKSRIHDVLLALNSNNYVSEEISSKRMEICNSCPELLQVTKQCKKCMCFMLLKTKVNNVFCPLEKW